MSADEIRAFLDRSHPALIGVVSTLSKDGSPHAVPVWYRYDGEDVSIWTHEERGWVRNLLRDSRVALSVCEGEPPFTAVVMRGRADVTTSDGQDVSAEIRRITRRYIDEQQVESYIAHWPDLRTIVRIRPLRITSWRQGY